MTEIELLTTISIELSTDLTTTQTLNTSISIIYINSPIVILIWFEIIAACLVYGLGFLGNIFSLVIFCSLEEFRKISTGSFFLFTTISNSFHLWTLSTEFLGIFNIYIYPNGFFQCRLNYFIQNLSRAISTYLAIGIALDRLIRSELPIRSRKICTRQNSIIYTFLTVIIFSILWSPWLSPTIIRDLQTGTCIFNLSPSIYFFLVQIQTPLRLIIVCIIPVIIMASANIRMLYNMRQSRRRVKNRVDIHIIQKFNPIARRMAAIDRMLFYMMVANVSTFIITQIPFNTYTTIRSYYPTLDAFNNSLVRALLLIWSSIYFGIAFYLYCLASPLFREKIILISKKFLRFITH